ncbi:unnamed protein product [Brassicogethes aeneus]|uniref:Microsomal glutathione S-transferase 1 n=1 Tax=Brassicogethes aeneus TaxID=1431903 RepID=A0A9P0B157_BRAAE|nr:unnamed protein product [Brassicogethes aeneus]
MYLVCYYWRVQTTADNLILLYLGVVGYLGLRNWINSGDLQGGLSDLQNSNTFLNQVAGSKLRSHSTTPASFYNGENKSKPFIYSVLGQVLVGNLKIFCSHTDPIHGMMNPVESPNKNNRKRAPKLTKSGRQTKKPKKLEEFTSASSNDEIFRSPGCCKGTKSNQVKTIRAKMDHLKSMIENKLLLKNFTSLTKESRVANVKQFDENFNPESITTADTPLSRTAAACAGSFCLSPTIGSKISETPSHGSEYINDVGKYMKETSQKAQTPEEPDLDSYLLSNRSVFTNRQPLRDLNNSTTSTFADSYFSQLKKMFSLIGDNQRQILSNQTTIMSNQDDIISTIQKVDEKVTNLENAVQVMSTARGNQIDPNKPEMYPCMSLEDFRIAEEDQEESSRKLLESYLGSMGAENVRAFISMAMKEILSDNVVEQFTVNGNRGKKEFGSSKHAALILRAARECKLFEGPLTRTEFLRELREVFRSTKQRVKNKREGDRGVDVGTLLQEAAVLTRHLQEMEDGDGSDGSINEDGRRRYKLDASRPARKLCGGAIILKAIYEEPELQSTPSENKQGKSLGVVSFIFFNLLRNTNINGPTSIGQKLKNRLYLLSKCESKKFEIFISSEDAAWFNGEVKIEENIERVRRAFYNDMENIPLFFIAALAYLFTDPQLWLVNSLFIVFLVVRALHSFVYAVYVIPQPTRAILWFIGFAITGYMAIHSAINAFVAGYVDV